MTMLPLFSATIEERFQESQLGLARTTAMSRMETLHCGLIEGAFKLNRHTQAGFITCLANK